MVKRLWPIVCFSFAGLLVLSFTHMSAHQPASPRPGPSHADLEYSACRTAQRFVSERLLAPRDAAFEDCLRVAVQDDAGTFSLTSYVDAPNLFDARIRTTYQAALQPASQEGQRVVWTLVSLETK